MANVRPKKKGGITMTLNEKKAYEMYIEEQTSQLLLKMRINQAKVDSIKRERDKMIEDEIEEELYGQD